MSSRPIRQHAALYAALGLAFAATEAPAQADNFQMTVDHVKIYTPFHPDGFIDTVPPYTMCATYHAQIRFRYTWRHNYQDQVYTEPVGTFYPWYYVQSVFPNPVWMPAASVATPAIRTVFQDLITGPVNTGGQRYLTFRGRSIGMFGPAVTASVNVLFDTQLPPSSMRYREIADQTMDMPLRPWFGWTQDLFATSYRLDIGACGSGSGGGGLGCGSQMPFQPLTSSCGNSDYCWIGSQAFHQTGTALAPNTDYEYRVHAINTCGLSEEQTATPVPRPRFRTAQACFSAGGAIPDGGVAVFNAATLGINPGSLVQNLRLTVHTDHAQVGDLRISLTKTSPTVVGPLTVMDQPNPAACTGRRMQVAFADGGASAGSSCKTTEPALAGRINPLQALGSFNGVEGAGTWQLRVEDTVVNGKSGSLLEWCLSSDVGLTATTYVPPPPSIIMENGFESP
jgi:subtilisin-like proprotein convertase family protein